MEQRTGAQEFSFAQVQDREPHSLLLHSWDPAASTKVLSYAEPFS